ncbi:unnamed protein product [Lampetra planeri]
MQHRYNHVINEFALILAFICAASAAEVRRPRGVSVTKRPLYDETKDFTCLDGSKTMPFDRVNDDYCDCKDGSDEPGTSACPNGNFHCTNAGYRPQNIPSSRVNDGICDCCDTTDEYNSGAVCENTCKELGQKDRENMARQAEVAAEGFRIKQQLMEETKRGKEEKQKKLESLKDAKQAWEDKVHALQQQKETAESPEKEAKERHQALWEEMKESRRKEVEKEKAGAAFSKLDENSDGFVSVQELQAHKELDADEDGEVTEVEVQTFLGGAETVDLQGFEESVWDGIKEKLRLEGDVGESPPPPPPAEPATPEEGAEPFPDLRYDEVDDEPREDVDDDVDDEVDDGERDAQGDKQDTLDDEDRMPAFDPDTQALIDAADRAREELRIAEKSLREVEDDIRSLEKELGLDLGPNGEFAYMYGKCFDMTTTEYVYKLCPFDRVTQKPKNGGSDTSLGTWGSWVESDGNKYGSMKYEHGMSCWQGPNRSTKVKLSCGKETVVVSTSEPSRCEYLMEVQTPALCQEMAGGDKWADKHTEL